MPRPAPPAATDESLRVALLAWFRANRRDLPWRRRRDPYAVWLSEVMLQQTQVSTVVPYFERFLSRFPDVSSLAAAPLPEVLALWKGLGYYSRARNLHRAAQRIAEQGMPATADALRTLPGLGRYTAAAVASLAFGEPVAVLDGNVSRVLARLRAIEGPLGADEKRLWSEAEALLDRAHPGEFNESMMELGALVCVPQEPRCGQCPLAFGCAARAAGLERQIPAPKLRPVRKRLDLACAVIFARGELLLARREEKGLFGGLWELPSVELRGAGAAESLGELGLTVIEQAPLATVRRTLTHRELTMSLLRCRAPRRPLPGYVEQRRVGFDELAQLGISAAMARALGAARAALEGDGDARLSPSPVRRRSSRSDAR